MKTNAGFLVTKIRQQGERIFGRILSEKNVDAFNGPQGRILYVLWQREGISIKALSDECGLAVTSLTTMLERMEKAGLIRRKQDGKDKRRTLLYLTDKAKGLEKDYDAVSEEMARIYFQGFTKEEILRFEDYLERVLKNLEGRSLK